jgi:hypothetical protein
MSRAKSVCGVIAVVAGLTTGVGQAATVTANIGLLTRMWVHATFGSGSGDVWFVGTTGGGSCQAFWLRGADIGVKNLYAVLLAARATGRPVLVYANDNELWSGSGSPSCRVEAIDFAD